MKRLLIVGVVIALLLWAREDAEADRGRKYYEEAGHVIWEINTEDKIIAITFDDGPHKKYTAQILDLLKKYDAKATFFVVGQNVEKYPELVMRMNEDGHEVAIHTYTHAMRSSIPRLREELKRTRDLIYSITGTSPTLFRPVAGIYTDEMIDAVVQDGYKVVMWSWHQDTLDWRNPGVPKIVKKVLDGSRPGNVVLFHDGGGKREQTVKAMEKILPELAEQGYQFVTITELMNLQEELQEVEKQELKGKEQKEQQ